MTMDNLEEYILYLIKKSKRNKNPKETNHAKIIFFPPLKTNKKTIFPVGLYL